MDMALFVSGDANPGPRRESAKIEMGPGFRRDDDLENPGRWVNR